MTENEYALADKLKSRFFLRDDAMAYCRETQANGRRRRRGRNYNFARPVDARPMPKSFDRPVAEDVRKEVVVENGLLNPLFIACIAVATIMLLALVMCFAEVCQSSSTVGSLESQLTSLEKEKSELAVRLDAKNDLKQIETIATTKLGMVKEDSIQKRFVSLSEGEHIEVLETEEDNTGTSGGVLLSSVFASIGRFFDRFK